MAQYRFVTDLTVTAPPDAVYGTLVEPEGWLGSWPDVVRVIRVADGAGDGVGGAFDASVRAPWGYRLSATITTVAARAHTYLRMRASGDLEGFGTWRLVEDETVTHVRFRWDVRTTPRWLNLLTPVARPVFERSHHVVVRHAAEAAAAHLDADLQSVESRAVRNGSG